MKKEVCYLWKCIECEGETIKVSSEGEVHTTDRLVVDSLGRKTVIPGQVLKQNKNGSGYNFFKFKGRTIMVHRAVAHAFLGTELFGKGSNIEIHHINYNKSDNSLRNLEPMTKQENINDYYEKFIKVNLKDTTCFDCGIRIQRGLKRCFGCDEKEKLFRFRVVERPSRSVLIVLLANNTFRFVGNLYGVSDKAIANWCRRMEIPTKAGEYKEIKAHLNQ